MIFTRFILLPVLACLFLTASLSSAQAQLEMPPTDDLASLPSASTELEKLIERKQTRIDEELIELGRQKKKFEALQARLEQAKRSQRMSDFVAVPSGVVGAVLALGGVSGLMGRTSGRMARPIIRLAQLGMTAVGTTLVVGSKVYIVLSRERLDLLLELGTNAQVAVGELEAKLHADRAELEALRQLTRK